MPDGLQVAGSKPLSLFAPAQITSMSLIEFLDISPDALVIVDQAGTIVMVNQQIEALFGYSSQELLGKHLELLLPQRYRNVHIVHREHYFASPLTRPMGAGLQLLGLRKDNIEFPVDISLRPLMLESVPHVIGAVRDVTKLKDLEEQNKLIQKADRLKSEFLANMSHELRTPLNSIIGFCEMLYDELVGPLSARQRSCLSEVLNSSRHLLRLINDVLDLARVESGKMIFEPEPVELKQLIEDVQAILHPLITKKYLHVDLEVDASVTEVMIDPAKFKQVLYNYLSNAIKFTPEKGKIGVRILPETATSFRLEVEDTGIGIKAEDIERLFIAFQQLDNSTSKQFQGTGLGLALVKHLVETQGGRVGVRSVPGVGSTFFAVLPRVGEKTADEEKFFLPASVPGQPDLLIVEDERRELEELARHALEAGYNVDYAVRGTQAREKCQIKRFDVIALDLILPDMDGWDLLHTIRVEGPNSNTPVIVVTMIKEKRVGIGLDIEAIFTKPILYEEIIGTLKRLKEERGVASDGKCPHSGGGR